MPQQPHIRYRYDQSGISYHQSVGQQPDDGINQQSGNDYKFQLIS